MISDLGSCANGAAVGSRASSPRDCNRGGNSRDRIAVRFVQTLKELPCIGRKTLDVASLPLGVEGVQRQRRFTAS